MSTRVDIDRVSRLIVEAAAEEIMPRYTKLAAGDVREKGPGDLVTVADEAMEHRLTALLQDLLPGSAVVGEEAAARDGAVLRRLATDEPVWIIDPVDGTSNFAQAKGDFGVMVALVVGGRGVAGWIYDPVGGRMATAELGAGAWLNGKRLSVAAAPEIRRSSAEPYWPGSMATRNWGVGCSSAASGSAHSRAVAVPPRNTCASPAARCISRYSRS